MTSSRNVSGTPEAPRDVIGINGASPSGGVACDSCASAPVKGVATTFLSPAATYHLRYSHQGKDLIIDYSQRLNAATWENSGLYRPIIMVYYPRYI